jgi:hypothetical protein
MTLRKYHQILSSFFMALLMSGIMSFVISIYNVGMVSHIITVWIQAWGFAFIVAFPTVVIVSPIVHKLVSYILNDESDNFR